MSETIPDLAPDDEEPQPIEAIADKQDEEGDE